MAAPFLTFFLYATGVFQYSLKEQILWKTACHFLWIPFHVYYVTSYLYYFFQKPKVKPHESSTAIGSYVLMGVLLLLMDGCKIIYYWSKANCIKNFLSEIKANDKVFKKFGAIPRQKSTDFVISLIFLVIILQLTNYAVHLVPSYVLIPPLCLCSVNLAECYVVFEILFNIRQKFKIINQQFQNIQKTISLRKIFPRTEIHVLDRLSDNETDFYITMLQILSNEHFKLTELAVKCNKLFSKIAWIAAANSFVDIIFRIYDIIHILKKHPDVRYNIYREVVIIMVVLWLLFMRILPWVMTSKEANKSSVLFHDVRNEYAENIKMDVRLQHLQLLSTRFFATKQEFTANDYFQLDWAFFHSFLASLSTYIIIILQFNV